MLLFWLLWTLTLANEEIIQGREAPFGKYRYSAHLRSSLAAQSTCGASLIAPRFLLTAAHCKVGSVLYAVVGDHYNSDKMADLRLIHRIKRIYIHPSYNVTTNRNDIAIVELEDEISTIQPVLLGRRRDNRVGRKCTVAGWGVYQFTPDPQDQQSLPGSTTLRVDDYRLMQRKDCEIKMKAAVMDMGGDVEAIKITPDMICVNSDRGEGPCYGDSGSALVINANATRPVQIGIVSWGAQCGKKDMPAAFASVPALRCFIDSIAHGHQWHGEADPVTQTKPCLLKLRSAATLPGVSPIFFVFYLILANIF